MVIKYLRIVSLQLNKLNEIILVLLGIFTYLFFQNHNFIFLCFLFLSVLFLIKKPHYILIGLLIGISMIIVHNFFWPRKIVEINGNYRVKNILSSGIVIEEKGTKILVSTKQDFRFNDLVKIQGKVSKPKNFNGFDFVSYLKTKNIENILSFPSIKLVGQSQDIRSLAREYLSSGPTDYKQIAPLILLGEKTKLSKPFYDISIKLSIVHLFVISGFHISLFYLVITKILVFIKINKFTSEIIALIFILIYLFLLNFPLSATRASLLTIFIFINKNYFKSKFNPLQILALVMAIFCIYNPWVIKSLSFIFTFIATGTILFLNGFNIKNKWKKNLLIFIGVYISTIFIAIAINKYISLLGIFFGIFLMPIFSFLFIISTFLFPFKNILSYVYFWFKQLLFALNWINILIEVPNMNKNIAHVIYLIFFSCFIIIKIWNLSLERKVI